MSRLVISIFLVVSFLVVNGQTIPDKIVLIKNTYVRVFSSENEWNYDSDTILLTSKKGIAKLYSALIKFDDESSLLGKFGIDTNHIVKDTSELLKLYHGANAKSIDWNTKQKEFIFKKITDIGLYKSVLKEYLSEGCCYTMHNPYRYQYVLILYNKENVSNIFTSRKSLWGFHFPYKDLSGKVVYNFDVDKQLNNYFNRGIKVKKPMTSKKLLKHIVNRIIEYNMREIYKLSPFTYEKEISELKTDFDIISTEEVYGYGRYIWDEPKTMKITLKNRYMLPNVYLQFLDSKYGKTLYPRDSIKKDYQKILARIQAISFITDYLQQDSTSSLDIYYFNNSGINKYNIDGVNKKPTEWKKYDEYVKRFKWYANNNINPSVDLGSSSKTSERIYCGCNYRFESSFIKKAIFFEITSKVNPSSIWFLLPDDTVLLYHLESHELNDAMVLNMKLNRFGDAVTLPFACLLFDKSGSLIQRK